MKSTGIVRPVDNLGRVVIPMEIRSTFDINPKDSLEIFTEGDKIILKKYRPSCVFCGNADDVVYLDDKRICRSCIEKISKLAH